MASHSMAELLAGSSIVTAHLTDSVLSVHDLGNCLTGIGRTGSLGQRHGTVFETFQGRKGDARGKAQSQSADGQGEYEEKPKDKEKVPR